MICTAYDYLCCGRVNQCSVPTPAAAVLPLSLLLQSSWDILAIYPESTTSSGSYRDPVIADAIVKYNRAIVRAQGGQQITGPALQAGGVDNSIVTSSKPEEFTAQVGR